jgi:anti-sigma-K factor RskA
VTIDQDKDVLAAEYVLGTLGGDERAEAQALIAIDPDFAAVVRGWERRLGELSAMVDPVEPPTDMWDRIKAGVAIADRSAAVPPPVAEVPRPAAAEPPKPSVAEPPTPPVGEPTQAAAGEISKPADDGAPAPIPPPAEAAVAPAGEVVATAPEPVAEIKPPTESPAAPPAAAGATVAPAAQPAGEVVQLRRRVARWRFATAGIGALAACFAAVVLVREVAPDRLPAALQPKPKIVEVVKTVEVPSPRPAEFVAIFQKDDASPAFLLTFDIANRMLTVRRVGAEQQAGKSYELWLVSDKYPAPRSLGVVGSGPYTVKQPDAEYDPVIINRATYAISLEPEGGSPTGAPTGPVLYHGRLLRTTAPDVPRGLP